MVSGNKSDRSSGVRKQRSSFRIWACSVLTLIKQKTESDAKVISFRATHLESVCGKRKNQRRESEQR